MSVTPFKAKGRKGDKSGRTAHSFVMFQHRMLKDKAFLALTARACKALLFLAAQYKGTNNGDLTIAWTIAKDQGWTSNGTLRRGVKELIRAGFVIQTRQGGRNRCSLFALAWFPIDPCGGKLEVAPGKIAPNDWLFKNRMSEPPRVQGEPLRVQSA